MDISDGLISDMSKLINKQKLSFEIDINKIPISKMLKSYLKKIIKKNRYLFQMVMIIKFLFTSYKKHRRNLLKIFLKK